jgi:hypothetical protein
VGGTIVEAVSIDKSAANFAKYAALWVFINRHYNTFVSTKKRSRAFSMTKQLWDGSGFCARGPLVMSSVDHVETADGRRLRTFLNNGAELSEI